MVIPRGMTEEQVVQIIDGITNRLAGKFKFGYHDLDDMKQQARLFAWEGLENYDGLGAGRDLDGAFPIDPSGSLPTGETIDGPEGLKKVLKSRETFIRALAEKMLTFALGRGLEYYDKCAVDEICRSLKVNGHKFSTLLHGVVNSKPFRLSNLQKEKDD